MAAVQGGVWLVWSTLGEMTREEVVKECGEGSWAPLVIWREGDKIVVPWFGDQETAIKFCKRNFGTKICWGTLDMVLTDVEKLDKMGWEFRKFTFPNIVKDRVKLEIEVFQLCAQPTIHG